MYWYNTIETLHGTSGFDALQTSTSMTNFLYHRPFHIANGYKIINIYKDQYRLFKIYGFKRQMTAILPVWVIVPGRVLERTFAAKVVPSSP
jgi:hypothetical protein